MPGAFSYAKGTKHASFDRRNHEMQYEQRKRSGPRVARLGIGAPIPVRPRRGQVLVAAITAYRIAEATMPLWKLLRSRRSFGACAFSSGSPTPKRTAGSPSSRWKVDTTGIE